MTKMDGRSSGGDEQAVAVLELTLGILAGRLKRVAIRSRDYDHTSS